MTKDNIIAMTEKIPHPPKDGREIWEYIALIYRSLARARTVELRKYKITSRHAATLEAIYNLGYNATPTKIARSLFREPNSISEILHRMQKIKLVTKLKDADNKKQVKYILTEKGIDAYNKSRKRLAYKKLVSVLSKDEQDNLKAILKILLSKAFE